MVDDKTRKRKSRRRATKGAQNEQELPSTSGPESHFFSEPRHNPAFSLNVPAAFHQIPESEPDFMGKTALHNMIGSILTLHANSSTLRDLVSALLPIILKASEELQAEFEQAGLYSRTFREGLELMQLASAYIYAILLETLPLDLRDPSAAVRVLAEALSGKIVEAKTAACSILDSIAKSPTLQLTVGSGLTAALYTLHTNPLDGGVTGTATTIAASSIAGLSAGAMFSDVRPDSVDTLKRLVRSVTETLTTPIFTAIPSSGYHTPSVFTNEEKVAVAQSVTHDQRDE